MHEIRVFDTFLWFLLSAKMDKNTKEWNKSKRLKEKNYLDRFNKLSVYSYVRNDKICLGVKPEEVSKLFSNACGRERCSVDQSAMQYYMILGLQDFLPKSFPSLARNDYSWEHNTEGRTGKNTDNVDKLKEEEWWKILSRNT